MNKKAQPPLHTCSQEVTESIDIKEETASAELEQSTVYLPETSQKQSGEFRFDLKLI